MGRNYTGTKSTDPELKSPGWYHRKGPRFVTVDPAWARESAPRKVQRVPIQKQWEITILGRLKRLRNAG